MFRLTLLLTLAAPALHGLPRDTARVLFIGNSHTFVNNVPMLVESLAAFGGRLAVTAMSAPGGYRLEEHTTNQQTLDLIAQGTWDYVVLQEQSQIPTIEYWRFNSMYPASRLLDSLIRQNNGRTMFYMTWGWKHGGVQTYGGYSSPPFRDYFHMQESVTVAYAVIAGELGVALSPVGLAWQHAKEADSLVDLWQPDSCHATLKGSYLGACVFYAVLFDADPTGLSYTAGLDTTEARFFQEIAWQTVSDIAEEHRAPAARRPTLHAFPNPFRPSLSLSLHLTHSTLDPWNAAVRISDASGRLVRTIRVPHDRASVSWDGRDDSGNPVPTGIYVVEVQSVATRASQRLVLLR